MSRQLRALIAMALFAGFFAGPGPHIARRMQDARADTLRGVELQEPVRAGLAVSPGLLPSGDRAAQAADTLAACTDLNTARSTWTLVALGALEPAQRAELSDADTAPASRSRALPHTPGELVALLEHTQTTHGAGAAPAPTPVAALPDGLSPQATERALLAWVQTHPLTQAQAWSLQTAALDGIAAHEDLPDCLDKLVDALGPTVMDAVPAGPAPHDVGALTELSVALQARLRSRAAPD
jgi:hypothetical protein